MPIPDFQTLILPILRFTGDGREHDLAEATAHIVKEFRLTEAEQREKLNSGQSRLYNRVVWSVSYLTRAKLLTRLGRGRFTIAERGREVLLDPPERIDIMYLQEKSPDVKQFRPKRRALPSAAKTPATFNAETASWVTTQDSYERVKGKLERAIPKESERRDALQFLASAIEKASEERKDSWFIRETRDGVKLMAGRFMACRILRSKVRVSVIGPVDETLRRKLGLDDLSDDSMDPRFRFKSIPGGLTLTFPSEKAAVALEGLRSHSNLFVEMAMAKVRHSGDLGGHVPEAIEYLRDTTHRQLPQPQPTSAPESASDDDSENASSERNREPHVRGRAPIFEVGQRSISSLVGDIERGAIALPELQRPFVWEDTKVRDLLDSLFVGFPVGTLVFWYTSTEQDARALGSDNPGLKATTLVIDGQQRLTSLYAVMKGVEVVGKDGAQRRINIAFRPRDGRFEVADAAIRNDPEFLPDVTELWRGVRSKPQMRRDLLNALRDKGHAVGEEYEDAVDRNIDRAHGINEYRFPTVDIRKTTGHDEATTEEDVAEIFVRINNQGTRLGQADFVLTLLSVFHGKLRDQIETRAREMSGGTVISVDTQQLLRAVCAVAFGRARMSAVYRYLRGVDPTTGEADIGGRIARLQQLDAAAELCMETTTWRDYLLRVQHAGFVSRNLIASRNAILNGYAFYIRGREARISKGELDGVVSRWVFASLLTARYSGASETMFEQDLARVTRFDRNESQGFVSALDDAISETLTGDYWTRNLITALETQKGRSPAALAFRAAQIVLGAKALFSDQLLQTFLAPTSEATRSASEMHHLFPVAWLHQQGVDDRRSVNQVANMADVAWSDNSLIGALSPSRYVPGLRDKLGIDDLRWAGMCAEHALPLGWETMQYGEFLSQRRQRMAEIIHAAFRHLGGERDAAPAAPPWFLAGAEVVWQQIVKTERALRDVVRKVYTQRYGEHAASRIRQALSDEEGIVLERSLRALPPGASALSLVDYLYLGLLPKLLFVPEVWQEARSRFGAEKDSKARLQSAIQQIAPVRNEIAHVREVPQDRLMRAAVACNDVLQMIAGSSKL